MLDWRTIACLYRRVKTPNKNPNPNAIASAEVGLRLIASVDSQSSSNSRRVDASKACLFGRFEATAISLTAFPSTFHLAPRDITRVDEGLDAVVLSAVLVTGLCAKVLLSLGNFPGLSVAQGGIPADR